MLSTHIVSPKRPLSVEKNTYLKKKINPKIWSNIKELCETLHIPYAFDINSEYEECRFQHVRYKAGQYIHRNGQNFESFYLVNSGFLKTVHLDDLHNDQILSFPMKGDMLGIDGMYSKRHASDAIALTTCDLIVLPYRNFPVICKKYADFNSLLFTLMSRDLARKQSHLCLIGSASSEARVAQFLVRLGERYGELGYSPHTYELRMARHEIGSYLGLTLETVSRTLTMFHDLGLITVARRSITINDHRALRVLRKLYPLGSKKHRELAAQPSLPDELVAPTTLYHTPALPEMMVN